MGAPWGCRAVQRAPPAADALWNVEVYGSRNAIHREQLAGQSRLESGGPVRPWPIEGIDADHRFSNIFNLRHQNENGR